MDLTSPSVRNSIRDQISCVKLHHSTEYANEAASLVGKQWNHKESEVQRNIKSMLEESKDNLPCHLALLINCPTSTTDEEEKKQVVGHIKLVRATSRGDGTACITYSLVVDEDYRGLGLGRVLTEEGEKFARALNISYMYLFTDDKVTFYEHLGYKQCEPISSLGGNAKRLNVVQLSALESLFAKRSNVESSSGHTWLRKRLILEYPFQDALDLAANANIVSRALTSINDHCEDEKRLIQNSVGVVNLVRWQQQTGPSCGISALNMLKTCLDDQGDRKPRNGFGDSSLEKMNYCNCSGAKTVGVDFNHSYDSMLDFALNSGTTNDGEMFCAHNLVMMAEAYHHMKLSVKDIATTDMEKNDIDEKLNALGTSEHGTTSDVLETETTLPMAIIQSVCKGFPVLIPYDKSNAYTPTNGEGHHAHWAIITGIILPQSSFQPHSLESSRQSFSSDYDVELFDVSDGVNIALMDGINFRHDLLLVCMHGMCEKPFVCSYEEIVASNAQLKSSKSKFYLASEGLVHLRNKVIFVE